MANKKNITLTYMYTKGNLYLLAEVLEEICANDGILDKLVYKTDYDKEVLKKQLSRWASMADTAIGTNQELSDYTEQEQVMLKCEVVLDDK